MIIKRKGIEVGGIATLAHIAATTAILALVLFLPAFRSSEDGLGLFALASIILSAFSCITLRSQGQRIDVPVTVGHPQSLPATSSAKYTAPATRYPTATTSPVSSKKGDQYFERALDELNKGHYEKSLWVTAMTAAGGDPESARHEYARVRASILKDTDRALAEVGTDWYDKELWAKAMVATNGDTDIARYEYARLRVDYWQSRAGGKPASFAPAVNQSPAQSSSSEISSRQQNMVLPGESLIVDEDAIYATIANEFESGATDKGLWIRLFAECDGDENRTKVAYIKQRAEKLTAMEELRLADQLAHSQTAAAQLADARRATVEAKAAFDAQLGEVKEMGIWHDGSRYRYRAHQFDELDQAVAFVLNQNAQQ